ncbi:MAG: LURP-one-related family protein, partial [Singulisphaera sp.]
MRYVMKQKLLSWGDDFVIEDESGRDTFHVDGKAFGLGDALSFRDMRGNELASIRQTLLARGPTYEIHGGGALKA